MPSLSRSVRRSAAMAVIVLVAAAITGCGGHDRPDEAAREDPDTPADGVPYDGVPYDGFPREIVERLPDGGAGRRVRLESPPQRIVSVTQATDEILVDMVPLDRIAALSYLSASGGSLVADRVRGPGGVETFVGADVEPIIALAPDLCLLAHYNRAETRTLLADSGVPVLTFHAFDSIADVRSNILTVGRTVGADARAAAMVREMDRRLAAIRRRLPARSEWPTVLTIAAKGWVSGAGTLYDEVITAAGARNAAAESGVTGFGQLTLERVVALDPDWFILHVEPGAIVGQRNWLEEQPALARLHAIRDERYVRVPGSLLSSASHRLVEAVEIVAAQLHPTEVEADAPEE